MTKKNNKKNRIGIIISTIIVLFLGSLVFLYLNSEDEDTSLSILEKQWIENNKSNLIDIDVVNNIDIFAKDGTGVVFDFLKDFETNTELKFNLISYLYPDNPKDNNIKIMLINSMDDKKNSDLEIANINYLLIGRTDNKINNINELTGSVGILENDSALINYYLKENSKISIKIYKTIDYLISDYNSKNVDNMIVLNNLYLDKILNLRDKYVNYQINDIYNSIIIRLGDNNKLNNIITKYFHKWQKENKLYDCYNKGLFNYYINVKEILDKDKKNLSVRTYSYGYVENIPYNILVNEKLYGLAGEYINMLSTMDNIEFKYVKYNNTNALIEALDNRDIDIAFVNFNYNSDKYLKTSNHFIEQVVGLSNNYINATSLKSLNNYNIYTYQKTYIYEVLSDMYSKPKVLNKLKNNLKNNVLVIDKDQYLYYASDLLVDYKLLFTDNIRKEYNFMVSKNNELLYNILDFIIDYSNSNNCKNISLNNLYNALDNSNIFKYIFKFIIILIIVPIIVIFLFIKLSNKIKERKLVKKEDILKYNDVLTSLKNRNYLIANMKKWGEMNIYPRTIVIIDLNKLKYVNDNYGYDSGNDLIAKAGSILINTQLEKSEIIRTDGNEFLIYLLGYSDKQIETYVNKLQKELEKLPYGFGAAIGYSTIFDEIKTIDDAINEATIEMRKNKEQLYNNIKNKD